MRKYTQSGTPWEEIVGYSRAVRVGNIIEVSGTTAMDGDILVGKDDVYAQAKFILNKINYSLLQLNSSLQDVVRTRMYVKDISAWEQVAKAHHEYFNLVKPATSMIEVNRLIHDELLIEIEVTAIIG